MLGLPATSNLTSDAIKFNAVAYPPSLITVCKIVNRLNWACYCWSASPRSWRWRIQREHRSPRDGSGSI